ncbi:MAG: MurR/RpiR family transcriptional regulator [Desulfobacterales bacterium]|nr:MAG: MurR/RpiR family transcriptional regulator [Desulfobacterales bacterium]
MPCRKNTNILQLLRDSYGNLNDTNRRISDFILNNLDLATFASLTEISKKVGVSDATLVRYARELGYNGFRELREDLVAYIRQIIYPAQKASLLKGHDKHPLIDLVTNKDIEYITKTMAGIYKKDFEKLIEYILQARNIFCMGWGISSFLAEYLSFCLRLLSLNATPVIRERRPMIQQLLFIDKDDLLIAFDQLLYSAEVLEAIEYVHEKKVGARVVTVTNQPRAQIVQFSDINFTIDMSGHEFMLISLTAPFCFINAIAEQIASTNTVRTEAALGEFQRVVQSSRLHYSQFDR